MTPSRNERQSRRDSSGGFILLSVLAVLALLSGLIASAVLVSQSAAGGTRVAIDQLVEEVLLEAGLRLAAYQLYGLAQPASSLNGQQIRFDDGVVTLFATSETGRVDLNASSSDLLAAAAAASGLSEMSASEFASRVASARQSDAVAAALSFRSISQMATAVNLSTDAVRTLRPFLTVTNPLGTIDPLEASTKLLAALPGVTEADIAAIVRLKNARRTARSAQLAARILGDQPDVSTEGSSSSHEVRVELRRPGRPVTEMTATLIRSVTEDALYNTVARSPVRIRPD